MPHVGKQKFLHEINITNILSEKRLKKLLVIVTS